MKTRLDRVRAMSREELSWRAAVAARTSAQRVSWRVRAPRWNRHALRDVLAPGARDTALDAAFDTDDWPAAHTALAARLRSRAARFPLDPRDAADLRGAIVARWPAAPRDAAGRANRLLAGEYDLLGYRGLEPAGEGALDWHRDSVHRRRAPETFWADVPFLDPAVGDHKIIWELNRHQHWLALGRALWLTGDRRYAGEILDQLDSWLAANPPLTGINWASMLEIGFRSISWVYGLQFLLKHEGHDVREDHEDSSSRFWLVDMLIALDRQLTHVEQNLSYYFSPNTHLTGEALALYVVGQALPELAGSARWTSIGRRILLSEIDRQVLPDGGHVERSTHYHRYTLDFYLLALLAARRAGDDEAAGRFADAVARLAAFARTMADDSGRLPLIGDDDGGMLWPVAGRACSDIRDSLAAAALVLDAPELASWGVPEEAFWIAGRVALDRESSVRRETEPAAPVASQAFADTGYLVLRDRDGGHAIFDVGTHGYMNGGHAHADALAFTLALGGRPLLVDPGTSTYTMDPGLRDRLRSGRSHNTVVLDGVAAAEPAGPFHWGRRADARLVDWRHNPGFDWGRGAHDAWAPVRHVRTLLRTAHSGWLVLDEIVGDSDPHTAVAHWHFDPAWMVTASGPRRLRAAHFDGQVAWVLHEADEVELRHGDADSGMGWMAPAYGTLVPAWTAALTQAGRAPFTRLTWIGAARTTPRLERVLPAGDAAATARVIDGDRVAVFLLPTGDAGDGEPRGADLAEYHTDARVCHYASDDGRLIALDLVDATHALALRDGWISIAAAAPIPDLHAAFDGHRLDLAASAIPSCEIRIEGAAAGEVHRVRANGRELPQSAHERSSASDILVIQPGHWGAPAARRPSEARATTPSALAVRA